MELTSSSVFENDTKRWGPDFVIDGVISHNVKSFFHSELEDYPWLQWHLPRQVKMLGITLTTRFDCCGSRLRDVEIRAGKSSTKNGTTKDLLDLHRPSIQWPRHLWYLDSDCKLIKLYALSTLSRWCQHASCSGCQFVIAFNHRHWIRFHGNDDIGSIYKILSLPLSCRNMGPFWNLIKEIFRSKCF